MANAVEDTLRLLVQVRGTARAERDLSSLNQSAQDLINRLDDLDKDRSRGPRRLSDMLNTVSGRLKILLPMAVGAGPAFVSLASSLAGAAGGAALLGGAGLTAAVVGLGGLAAVTAQAVGGLDKVRTAQDAYNLAVEQHGRYSDQALTALEKLNAQVELAGGAPVRELVDNIDALKDSWKSLTGPAREDVFGTMNSGLAAGNRLLPTFAKQTNATAASVRADLMPALRDLSGPEANRNLMSLSGTFRGLASSAIGGGTDLIVALLRHVVAAGPYVVQAGRGFAEWAHSFRAASSDSGRVSENVRMLVGHTRAWWGLLTALGGLAVAVFGASNAEGRSLVLTITDGVNRLTLWVEQANASGEAQEGFAGWVALFVSVGTAVGKVAVVIADLAQSSLPGLQSGASGLHVVIELFVMRLQILAAIIEFLGPLVGPLIVAFVAWKIATTALTVATTLLRAALLMSPFGWVVLAIGLVVAGFILLYNKVGWFRAGVDAAWSWIKQNWPLLLMILTGPVGIAVGLITKNWDRVKAGAGAMAGFVKDKFNGLIGFVSSVPGRMGDAASGMWDGMKGAFKSAYNWVVGKWNGLNLTLELPGVLKKLPGPDRVSIGTPDIPMLAQGGDIYQRGMAIVGDNGPEVYEAEAGARVTPLPKGGAAREVVRFVTVDGRVLAEAVFDAADDEEARK